MKETATGRGAKDVLLYDCGMSPDKYMTALDNAIAQGVDVLIVCPPDQKLSQITVQRCTEANIKVMADDDGLIDENGTHIAPALELDAYKVGEGIGEYPGQVRDRQQDRRGLLEGRLPVHDHERSVLLCAAFHRRRGQVHRARALLPGGKDHQGRL